MRELARVRAPESLDDATGALDVIGYPSPQSGMNVRSGLGLP